MRADAARFLARNRWVWAALGVLVLWVALSLLTERVSLHSLSGVAASSAFLLIAALGQMLVVTTGRGNIDLSIPSVITLSAYLTVIFSGGLDANLPTAALAVLGLGLGTGLVNAALVLLFRIPAIIATLATGYMLATLTLLANRQVKTGRTAETLAYLAAGRVGGVPVVAIIALVLTVGIALVLGRLAYGRHLSATGQSWTAARLAGVPVGATITVAFVASGVLASLSGTLLSAYSGGAFLEMGTPYLLQTVGAVVLGGTLIAGGAATAAGTLFGSVLLVLIIVTMQIGRLPPGSQDIVQGIVIILVLAIAGSGRKT
jgi:ribose transport system permease protein